MTKDAGHGAEKNRLAKVCNFQMFFWDDGWEYLHHSRFSEAQFAKFTILAKGTYCL